jgi:phosphoribosylformylglycinamidine synthase I
MKFGVIVFPGSNCDADMIYTLREKLGQEVVSLWHKDTDLQGCDFLVLPGGFSYGDYLRSGAISRFSPIMENVVAFAKKGGYVLGVCNGFQILCEAGLLPGALMHNNSHKFICKNVHLVPQSKTAAISKNLDPNKALQIPIAHGEGKYFIDKAGLQKLKDNDQIIFRYSDADGKLSNNVNPNGSMENIAGVCNLGKNVFGMMPHPERAADNELGNTDGALIFESILKEIVPA